MPRLDLAYKCQKVLKFLLAFLDGRIVGLLEPRGLTIAVRARGWELLVAAGGGHLALPAMPLDGADSRERLARLQAFAREWLDVVSAALEHHFPALHEDVYRGLAEHHDAKVILTVMPWLDRLAALATRGNDGPRALALLAERGFTAEVRSRGRALLEDVTTRPVVLPPSPDAAAVAARDRAEEELWAWYQDWSRTARAVVKRKDLRIKLGLSNAARAGAQADEPAPDEPPA